MIYANLHAAGRSNNSLFAAEDSVHRFNPTYMPRLLRETFLEQGVEINTPDVNRGREIAFDLYFEGQTFDDDGIPKYLIAMENPYHNRLNEDRDYYRRFRKVFTFDKRFYDLPNVVGIMVPHSLEFDSFPSFAERDIFSCLINANKSFRKPIENDLYVERIKTIRWYERHAPQHFELYGMGWQKPTPAYGFVNKVGRSFSRMRSKLFGYKPFPSYRGEVKDKSTVLLGSKYSYCYENTLGPDNYITEKIFDSFVCGCVPIYWGPENALEHIPADCFIDRSTFKNTAAVHSHLLTITPVDYAAYQARIEGYLKSDAAKRFDAKEFALNIAKPILQDVQSRGTDVRLSGH